MSFASGLGIISTSAGGSGNFANPPSPSTIVFFLTSPSVVMNVAAGFTTGFSFYYSSSTTGNIIVYDGLNATGNVLATIPITAQYLDNNCQTESGYAFCNWTAVGASFSGTAHSVDLAARPTKPDTTTSLSAMQSR